MGISRYRIWPFYLDSFVTSVLYFIPIYMIVFYQNLNLSTTQIGVLLAIALVFQIFMEVPTGAVADLFGRKASTLLGYLVIALGFLGIFFASNFYVLALLSAILGLGNSFVSGAQTAWITDNIGHKRQRLLTKVFTWNDSLSSVGFLFSGILGTWFVLQFGFGIIWLAGSLSFILGGIALMFARERKIRAKHHKTHIESIKFQLQVARKIAFKDKYLVRFLIATTLMGFALSFTQALVWIPFLQDVGYPSESLGLIWSLMAFVGIFAPILGMKASNYFKTKTFMIIAIVLWIISLLMLFFINTIVGAIAVLVATLLFDYARMPTENSYFQRMLKSKVRATVISFQSLLMGVAGAIGLPLAGLAVDLIGAKVTLIISGILLIPVAILFGTLKNYSEKSKSASKV